MAIDSILVKIGESELLKRLDSLGFVVVEGYVIRPTSLPANIDATAVGRFVLVRVPRADRPIFVLDSGGRKVKMWKTKRGALAFAKRHGMDVRVATGEEAWEIASLAVEMSKKRRRTAAPTSKDWNKAVRDWNDAVVIRSRLRDALRS